MRETKYWTWFIIAGAAIFFLLGLHMIVMHLDGILGWLNPAGGSPIEWQNVMARAKFAISSVLYVLLLGAALYHGLYGFRTVLFELNISGGGQRFINRLFWTVGLALFVYGSWAAVKFQMIAQAAQV